MSDELLPNHFKKIDYTPEGITGTDPRDELIEQLFDDIDWLKEQCDKHWQSYRSALALAEIYRKLAEKKDVDIAAEFKRQKQQHWHISVIDKGRLEKLCSRK